MLMRHLVSSSPRVLPWLVLFWCVFFPPFSGWHPDVSLLLLPVVWTFQNNGFKLATNWTMIQFNSDQDHLFRSDQILAVWSGLWSRGCFTFGFVSRSNWKVQKSGPNEAGVRAPENTSVVTGVARMYPHPHFFGPIFYTSVQVMPKTERISVAVVNNSVNSWQSCCEVSVWLWGGWGCHLFLFSWWI